MTEPGDRAPAPGPLRDLQALANTVDLESGEDALRTAAGLEAWAREHGLPGLRCGEADRAAVVALREALRAVCEAHAGTDLPDAAAAVLERLLARGPLVLAVDTAGGARLRPADGLAGADAVVAHLAAGVAAAVADGSWPRLKACAMDSCRWVYYDRSPAGRSRWCSMAVCGSRAKMRAYRRRGAAGAGAGRSSG
ncbi:CGNR zinc finger domain-containing protein [Streptacidiphilus sp. ASG 303]|uniref:CGNR zinc finger domain-containing protein n=1 Tax=Streptacidiphilus sp. ASG 303 TaxID=2896847 RepID=UPI001E37B2C6|nr:CGNR zinc finger domain-containing protein [Streptacidiphilus sp. ASG 303]MCD0485745.1 CGNR zinc finger domain-containing protein [Streptacidiphilus sp. ASG 303]